jgi:hypothetical protein
MTAFSTLLAVAIVMPNCYKLFEKVVRKGEYV